MDHQAISIRPFIGAKNFEESRRFYVDMGAKETVLSPSMSVFKIGASAFYLQKAYVRDWIDNSMIFLEVTNLEEHHTKMMQLQLPEKYKGVRVSAIRYEAWGKEYFIHDPSGILWHIGSFTTS